MSKIKKDIDRNIKKMDQYIKDIKSGRIKLSVDAVRELTKDISRTTKKLKRIKNG